MREVEGAGAPDLDRLHFRRQFLLGPEPFAPSACWSSAPLRHGLHLSVHMDLPYVRAAQGDVEAVLLGVAVHALEPHLTEQEILDRLLAASPDLETMIERSSPLAGRWVLIRQDGASTHVFTDPCGFRQVFFHAEDGHVWCGSQPEIIAAVCPLARLVRADLDEFVKTKPYLSRQSAWIGDLTPYDGCLHLMPNHHLRIDPLATVRFYPYRSLPMRSVADVVDAAVPMLEGILTALATRHDASLAISAGWDTRLLLAASRGVQDSIHYFVYGEGLVPEGAADSWVPQELSRRLGLGLIVRSCVDEGPEWFCDALWTNVTTPRFEAKTRTVWDKFRRRDERLNINGNAGEVCRSFYDHYGKRGTRQYTGADLAAIVGYTGIAFAESELDRWIEQMPRFAGSELTELDLLYWEQRLGNWGAQYPTEQDIACDEFSPFNCRLLMETLASAPRGVRVAPKYLLSRSLIEHMWPEVLDVPINPIPRSDVLGHAKAWIRPHLPEPLVVTAKRILGR
jgi:hypothetical protein